MRHASGLTLEQAPPISVPLRFFLTAPLFGLAAAMLLIISGPEILSGRWMPQIMALTHLMTLGFITMIMAGALLQMMPVVIGSPVWRPRLTSIVLHALLCLGVIALTGGFWFDHAGLMRLALLLLAVALIFFVVVMGLSLAQSRVRSSSASGIRLAVVALTIALAFGLRIGAEHVWQFQDYVAHSWSNIHMLWALIGWVGLLIFSIAYEVIPMFQLTPAYPDWMQRWLIKTMFVVLSLWTGAYLLAMPGWLLTLFGMGMAAVFVCFAITTLYLQKNRRRRRSSVTMEFWRIGMLALLAAVVVWISGQFLPQLAAWSGYGLLLGILYMVGFVVSAISGMLYKIVPFLIWFHLQSRHISQSGLPTVNEIIPENRARQQMFVHLSALLLLLLAVIWPQWFVYPAGLLTAASFLLLAVNLIRACRMYSRTLASLADSLL